jgi:hypothetical protein
VVPDAGGLLGSDTPAFAEVAWSADPLTMASIHEVALCAVFCVEGTPAHWDDVGLATVRLRVGGRGRRGGTRHVLPWVRRRTWRCRCEIRHRIFVHAEVRGQSCDPLLAVFFRFSWQAVCGAGVCRETKLRAAVSMRQAGSAASVYRWIRSLGDFGCCIHWLLVLRSCWLTRVLRRLTCLRTRRLRWVLLTLGCQRLLAGKAWLLYLGWQRRQILLLPLGRLVRSLLDRLEVLSAGLQLCLSWLPRVLLLDCLQLLLLTWD